MSDLVFVGSRRRSLRRDRSASPLTRAFAPVFDRSRATWTLFVGLALGPIVEHFLMLAGKTF